MEKVAVLEKTYREPSVGWAESDIFIGKSRDSRKLSSVSPGDIGA
jgi:hypothetical protein